MIVYNLIKTRKRKFRGREIKWLLVSFDAVVRSETRCFPTPRDVSTGSIVAFCRRSAETVFGPIVSRIKSFYI